MAALDLEEQEKLDELKAWWKAYGNLVMLATAAFVLGIAGTQGWRYYQNGQAQQAAELYDVFQKALPGKDPKRIGEAANAIMDKFPGSAYASRAAMISARASFDAGDAQNAKSRLEWALGHAKEDELKDLVRLRLAAILLDEKKFDEALKLLESAHGAAFDGLYADLKGDALGAQGKLAEARAAYQLAFDKTEPNSSYRNLIQMKLDALGAAK